eukprot:8614-Heterococcus_DN1.PRE.5
MPTVLLRRGQLGSSRQQHTYLLHQRPYTVPKEAVLCRATRSACGVQVRTVAITFIHTQKRNPVTHLKDPDCCVSSEVCTAAAS